MIQNLRINPATVARAYQELEQEGILGASRRRGTMVLGDNESPQRLSLRQRRLANSFNNIILDTRSQLFQPLLNIKSEEFRKIVDEMGGYDTTQTGETIIVK